jgi:hypothetical protein
MVFMRGMQALPKRLLLSRFFVIFTIACLTRLVVWYLIPLDWNWDYLT